MKTPQITLGEGELDDVAITSAAAAYDRGHAAGFQRGLIAAGEPWVALLFAVAGGLVGWGACLLVNAR